MWFQNTKTNFFSAFKCEADDPDSALSGIAKEMFDALDLTQYYIDGANITKTAIDHVMYPSECMKLLSIRQFEKDDVENMVRAMNSDGLGKYNNNKTNND